MLKKFADNVKRKGTWVFLYYGQDIAFACCIYIPGRICSDCVCCVHVLYRIVYTRLLQQQYLLSVGLFFFLKFRLILKLYRGALTILTTSNCQFKLYYREHKLVNTPKLASFSCVNIRKMGAENNLPNKKNENSF